MAEALSDKLARTRVGSMFFRSEDDSADNATENSQVKEVAQSRPSPAPVSFGSGVATAGSTPYVPSGFSNTVFSNVDPETKAKIQAIADGADQKSYTKFVDVVEKMKSKFSDEANRYHTAVVACDAVGLPFPEILKGVDAILGELSQAEQKFKQAAPQRLAAKVGARREKIGQIQHTVSEARGELQRLQEQMSRVNAEIVRLSQAEQAEQAAISQDERSLQEDTERFMAALEAVRAPYMNERKKIELYGRGA